MIESRGREGVEIILSDLVVEPAGFDPEVGILAMACPLSPNARLYDLLRIEANFYQKA